MNLETNLWENVNRNINREIEKGVAAYQLDEKDSSSAFRVQKEQYDKQEKVSESGSVHMAEVIYPNPMKQEKEETAVEELNQMEGRTAKSRGDELAVIANTVSSEDLKKMEEEGFSIMESDSRTIITVTDKIKAALAQAGEDVSSYGDGLTKEQLKQITGNAAVTNRIVNALKEHDLPETESNVKDSMNALNMAAGVEDFNEDAISYLLKNDLEPTIQNVYLAVHASSGEIDRGSENVSPGDLEELMPQMTAILEKAGMEVNEESVRDCKWLITHQIPLTEENLCRLENLKAFSGQLEDGTYDWDDLTASMAKAIAEGKRPKDGMMITARRRMEEARLVMTTEARAVMEKQGIQVDTEPMEALVEELKEQEKQYYRTLLEGEGVDAGDENVAIFSRTREVFEELKTAPAYLLPQVTDRDTVEEIHGRGEEMKRTLAMANERYETMQTAPRGDLGDSIQKAFRNVDDILSELKLEPSEGNRRAVRILAYNQMEITADSILEVKAKDETMQRAFRGMNPAVTLEMIRRGENPLDMTLEELNRAVEVIKEETGYEEQERFSRYLWKLEQNRQISEEERSSYIGIYRLIAQVEKTDGAAIGFLMHQGSDVTMRNLLTAVRSGKRKAMDYSVDDSFGGAEGKSFTAKIDAQIELGFQQNCIRDVLDTMTPEKMVRLADMDWESMTPEQMAEALKEMESSSEEQQAELSYRNEQLQMYRDFAGSSKDIYAYLNRYDVANNMVNLMAASNMLRKPNQMMERLFRQDLSSKESMELIDGLKQQVLEAFGEALKNPEELADAQEKLADVAEHAMDSMLIDDPATKSLDVHALRQMKTQFAICAKKAQEECYMIPVQTGDSVTGVSLKIVRGKEEKGWVDILFENGKLGKVAASFAVKENGISGMIAGSRPETVQLIKTQQQRLSSAISQDALRPEETDLKVAYISDLSLENYEIHNMHREQRMRENGDLSEDKTNPVQTARLYRVAEGFIQLLPRL